MGAVVAKKFNKKIQKYVILLETLAWRKEKMSLDY